MAAPLFERALECVRDARVSAAAQWRVFRYALPLRAAFGTSHSSTTVRTNVLLVLEVSGGAAGYAEVGLPPKKALCYEADVPDVLEYFDVFVEKCAEGGDLREVAADARRGPECSLYDNVSSPVARECAWLLRVLDAMPERRQSHAAVAGLEVAILDAWAKDAGVPVYRAFGLENAPRKSFITVSLQPSVDEMLESARFALRHTRQLKIKLNADTDFATRVLDALAVLCAQVAGGDDFLWSIDCNAAWSVGDCRRMMPTLARYAKHIYMVEQPFPLGFPGLAETAPSLRELDEWRKVKQEFGALGILVFGDESIFDESSLEQVADYVHGVNVKLEKAGGLRRSLRTLHRARTLGLRTWLGIMVSSTLNVNAIGQALPLCDFCDLDGSFLVHPDADLFTGGFAWSRPDGTVTLGSAAGFGVAPRRA